MWRNNKEKCLLEGIGSNDHGDQCVPRSAVDNLETQCHWWPVLSSTAQKDEDTRDPRKAAVPDPNYLGREGSALSIVGLFSFSVDWMRLIHSRKGIHFALSTNGHANLTLNTLTDKPGPNIWSNFNIDKKIEHHICRSRHWKFNSHRGPGKASLLLICPQNVSLEHV